MQKQLASMALVVLVLASIFLVACYPPMKAPLRVSPVMGPQQKSEPDTSVIKPGVTTRNEILQQFAAFDTGWKGKRLFLGRWLHSGMVLNGGRLWAGKIVAIEFDQKGVVTRYQVFSDDEFLHGQDSFLLTSANVDPDDQPSDPSLRSIIGDPISAEQIERLSCWRYARVYSPATTNPRDFGLVIHLKEKVYLERRGEKHGMKMIFLECDVLTAIRVVRFLRMSGERR